MSVTGNVSNIKIGFTKILSKPNTTATMTDVVKLATTTPGMKWAITITKMAVIRIRSTRFISINLYLKGIEKFGGIKAVFSSSVQHPLLHSYCTVVRECCSKRAVFRTILEQHSKESTLFLPLKAIKKKNTI